MANAPRITAKWKKEFDAQRYARALLALVEQLDQQDAAAAGDSPAPVDFADRPSAQAPPSPPGKNGGSSC